MRFFPVCGPALKSWAWKLSFAGNAGQGSLVNFVGRAAGTKKLPSSCCSFLWRMRLTASFSIHASIQVKDLLLCASNDINDNKKGEIFLKLFLVSWIQRSYFSAVRILTSSILDFKSHMWLQKKKKKMVAREYFILFCKGLWQNLWNVESEPKHRDKNDYLHMTWWIGYVLWLVPDLGRLVENLHLGPGIEVLQIQQWRGAIPDLNTE